MSQEGAYPFLGPRRRGVDGRIVVYPKAGKSRFGSHDGGAKAQARRNAEDRRQQRLCLLDERLDSPREESARDMGIPSIVPEGKPWRATGKRKSPLGRNRAQAESRIDSEMEDQTARMES